MVNAPWVVIPTYNEKKQYRHHDRQAINTACIKLIYINRGR